MKANEAPEKIYIQSFNISEEDAKFARKLYFDDVWTEEPESGQENIEYIRKDAFIEKAVSYLEGTLFNEVCYGEIRPDIVQAYINDFKKAMEQ